MEAISVATIAALVNGQLEGNPDAKIFGLAPIDQAREGELSFIAQPAYDKWLEKTPAAAVFVRNDSPSAARLCLIRVANPYLAFVRIAREVFGIGEQPYTGIHATAYIDASATLEDRVSLGPYAVIEAGVKIGANSLIGAQSVIARGAVIGKRCQIGNKVTIAHDVILGDEVIIQSGSVIGSDGFGYVRDGDLYYKIPHSGRVVLEDRVEIGANCTVDRGTFGETRIRQGAKLDNLIHVAHNVEIGENTVIAAQTGISGSTKIGKAVVIAGQVGFVGHITIGDRAVFGAQAGVTKSIPPGIMVSGYPAKPHFQARKEEAAIRRAPEMLKRLKKIEQWLAQQAPSFRRDPTEDDT